MRQGVTSLRDQALAEASLEMHLGHSTPARPLITSVNTDLMENISERQSYSKQGNHQVVPRGVEYLVLNFGYSVHESVDLVQIKRGTKGLIQKLERSSFGAR